MPLFSFTPGRPRPASRPPLLVNLGTCVPGAFEAAAARTMAQLLALLAEALPELADAPLAAPTPLPRL
jgi:hypothetical protein